MKDKNKKIVMIGPVYPYKGGIAHYTSLMCTALRAEHAVKMLSFKMQYPKLLYKKEQKDYSNDTFKVPYTHYVLDTADPVNCVQIAARIRKMNPDVVIFQWWHPYFSPCYKIMDLVLGKKIKKLFICHNVFPHESFPLNRQLSKWVLSGGDYFITHSGTDTSDLLSIKPDARYIQTVHPTYNAFKIRDMGQAEARQLLGIGTDEKVLLFFGFVRKYKGLHHLIDAMPEICQNTEKVRLLIVGDFGDDKQLYLDQMTDRGVSTAIDIYDGYIPDREVEKFFAASDLVVLPYESATQSGIVQIAYGFEKPVVVTNVGGLPDVVTDGKTGFIVEPQKPEQIAEAVKRFFEARSTEIFSENIRGEAYKYSWERMTHLINTFMEG